MKVKSLAKYYIQGLNLQNTKQVNALKNIPDSNKGIKSTFSSYIHLISSNYPTQPVQTHGDWSTCLKEILATNAIVPKDYSSKTIEDINKILNEISEESKDKKKDIILKVMRELNHIEQKWLTRIIIGDLKIGCNSILAYL